MKQKTITFENLTATITEHNNNDYEFTACGTVNDTYHSRGTMLDIIKTFAEWQWSELIDNPPVSIYYDKEGMDIPNPWVDSSGRFALTDSEACDEYGMENIFRFIINACELLRPDT